MGDADCFLKNAEELVKDQKKYEDSLLELIRNPVNPVVNWENHSKFIIPKTFSSVKEYVSKFQPVHLDELRSSIGSQYNSEEFKNKIPINVDFSIFCEESNSVYLVFRVNGNNDKQAVLAFLNDF